MWIAYCTGSPFQVLQPKALDTEPSSIQRSCKKHNKIWNACHAEKKKKKWDWEKRLWDESRRSTIKIEWIPKTKNRGKDIYKRNNSRFFPRTKWHDQMATTINEQALLVSIMKLKSLGQNPKSFKQKRKKNLQTQELVSEWLAVLAAREQWRKCP